MAELPKFSFGQPPTSGITSSVFGQPSSGASTTKGNLFGTKPGTPVSLAASPFAVTTTAPSGFGSSAFGSVNKTASSAFSFGPTPVVNTLGGDTSAGQATYTSNQPPSSNGFAALSTPNKPSEAINPSQAQPTGMFPVSNNAGGNIPSGKYAVSSSQAETSTPSSKPSTGILGTSTTPAGPPPTENTGTGSNSASTFNLNKPHEQKSSIFGSSTANPGFGILAQSSFLQPDSGKILFNKPIATSQPSLGPFSNLGKSKHEGPDASSTATTSSDAPNPGAQATANPFLTPNFGSSTAGANSQGSGISVFSSLGQKNSAGASTSGASVSADSSQSTSANPATSTMFNSLGAKNVSSGISATTITGTSGSSLFKPLPSVSSSVNATAVTSAATGQSTSSVPAPKSSASSGLGQSNNPAAIAQLTLPAATTSTSINAGNTTTNLGTSTAGPTPPAQSRLKNKSMDEIITRWASDLSKYQKEFQRQAEKVAAWDRMLVENSDKIQKLYGGTLEAERATTEVERQLTTVENDQDELAVWLDHYEREVNQMMSNQVGQGESLQGPDQERERT